MAVFVLFSGRRVSTYTKKHNVTRKNLQKKDSTRMWNGEFSMKNVVVVVVVAFAFTFVFRRVG